MSPRLYAPFFSILILSLAAPAFSADVQLSNDSPDGPRDKIIETTQGNGTYGLSYCPDETQDSTCQPIPGAQGLTIARMRSLLSKTQGLEVKGQQVDKGILAASTTVGAIGGGILGAVVTGAPTFGVAAVVGAGLGGSLGAVLGIGTGAGIAEVVDPDNVHELGEMDSVLSWAVQASLDKKSLSLGGPGDDVDINLRSAAGEITNESSAN